MFKPLSGFTIVSWSFFKTYSLSHSENHKRIQDLQFCQTKKSSKNNLIYQSGRSKYKTGVVSFLLCMTYHADITLTYFCIYNEFVTPILKTFVFLSRYPIYRLKPLMNNLRTLATHIDGRKWKIKIFCGRKIFMKSGPSFQHFHKKSHQKCHAILPHS